MTDIVWRLSQQEAVGVLEALTDWATFLEDGAPDQGDDPELVRIKAWADQLTDLIQQQRNFEALIQPGLVGLA